MTNEKLKNVNLLFQLCLLLSIQASHAMDHLTRNVDGNRTGVNNNEKDISPTTITHGLGGKKFGKITEYNVDEKIEAQPLVKTNVTIPGKGVHDVLYITTMKNSIYAIDARTGEYLWAKLQIDPAIDTNNMDIHGINTTWGISSTPVIDADTQTLYVVTWAKVAGNNDNREFRIHGLDLGTGDDRIKFNGSHYFPIAGNSFNGNVAFHTGAPPQEYINAGKPWEWFQKIRAGLALADAGNGRKGLVVAFSMNGEQATDPLAGHGFVFLFETRGLLRQDGISANPAIWSTTPGGALGGIWMAGSSPVVQGDKIYLTTGNGTIGGKNGQQNYGESFVCLRYRPAVKSENNAQPALDVNGFWTVFDDSKRSFTDQDIGSGGVLGVPGTVSLIGTGKDGVTYNVDTSKLVPELDGMRHIDKNTDQNAGQSENPNTWDGLVGNQPPMIATYFGPGGCTVANANKLNKTYKDRLIGLDCNHESFNPTKKYVHNHSTPVYWEPVGDNPIIYYWGENNTVKAYNYDKIKAQITGFRADGPDVASEDAPDKFGGMFGGFMTLSSNSGAKDSGVLFATFPPDGNANGNAMVKGRLVAYAAGDIDKSGTPPRLKRLRLDPANQSDAIDYGLYSKFTPPVVANGKLYVTTYNQHCDINGQTKGSVIIYGFK